MVVLRSYNVVFADGQSDLTYNYFTHIRVIGETCGALHVCGTTAGLADTIDIGMLVAAGKYIVVLYMYPSLHSLAWKRLELVIIATITS